MLSRSRLRVCLILWQSIYSLYALEFSLPIAGFLAFHFVLVDTSMFYIRVYGNRIRSVCVNNVLQ
jgi:hypothetical protein